MVIQTALKGTGSLADLRPAFRNDRIFLTGATGVLGANVLKEILTSTQSKVFCLVRAENAEAGLERLRSLLRAYDPSAELEGEFQKRVTPVLGDVVAPNLGIAAQDFPALVEQIDVTLHVAANTNLFSNFRRMEPINIGGTRNVIEVALATREKRFLYVSTFTVMGDRVFDSTFTFREEHLDVGQGFSYMTYQHTKFEAEKLVKASGERGLKWIITRPGQIFGEADTGAYPQGQTNVSGLFYDIFKTIIETKIALHVHAHYDVTPVDYVSEAIVSLAQCPEAYGHTFHLTNPDAKSYADVCAIVRGMGYVLEPVPEEQYKKMLFERRLIVNGEEYRSNTTKAFKWWYGRDPFTFERSAMTDCAYTVSKLAPQGILCPRIDEKLIGTYLEAGIRLGYFPAPPKGMPSTRGQTRSDRETFL